ncbi:catechol 2,3-dioxygenase [Microdochium nivale]|nr:catechol 2,3-dioxygenase [Microdochium nivale]
MASRVTDAATGLPRSDHVETQTNMGASIADSEAIGADQETIEEWRRANSIATAHQVRLVKLAHMRYQHPDLEEITTFMRDFGMHVVKTTDDRRWFRGYSSDQYVYFAQKGPKKFLGGTFEVESYADLEKAARLQGAGPIEELTEAPGGGHLVTVIDPEGFPVCFMHGQKPAEVGQLPHKLIINYEGDKPRARQFQRFREGPAAVHKLGHYGLCVQQFDAQLKWYTENFNLVPTDFLWIPAGADGSARKTVAVFARIDRGKDLVDHHSFFMSSNTTSHVHHCSFEVHDFDTQQLGHQWLAAKQYKSVWGVGRHILGSQIFDYWWDTTGNMVEHYADGDVINEDTPIGYGPAGDESLAVWGPEVPKDFLD